MIVRDGANAPIKVVSCYGLLYFAMQSLHHQPHQKNIMSTSNKPIVQRVNDAFKSGIMTDFTDCCTDDVRWTIVGTKTVTGKDEILRFMQYSADKILPGIIEIQDVFEEGERATCVGRMSMPQADGSRYQGTFCDVYHFRDGKIAELQSFVIGDKPIDL